MTIAAIPTVYNGVQFRSRLEARWAAFFDLCGWRWDYEPLDLNGWIPDFAVYPLRFPKYRDRSSREVTRGVPILVDVKPITSFCPETAEKMIRASRGLVEGRIRDYKMTGLLILGLNPFSGGSSWFLTLGWFQPAYRLALRLEGFPIRAWQRADGICLGYEIQMTDGKSIDPMVTFQGENNRDAILGEPIELYDMLEDSPAIVKERWDAAGNFTQWRGKQAVR